MSDYFFGRFADLVSPVKISEDNNQTNKQRVKLGLGNFNYPENWLSEKVGQNISSFNLTFFEEKLVIFL